MSFFRFLLFLILCFSQSAMAEFIRGVDLAKWCESQDPSDKAACLAYVLGVNDTMDKLSAGKKQKLYCLPKENFSSGDMYQVVQQFVNTNPKYAHQSASVITLLALQKKFPCN